MWQAIAGMAGNVFGDLLGSPGGSSSTTTDTKESSKTTTLDKDLQDLLEAVTFNKVMAATSANTSSEFSKTAAMGDAASQVNAFAGSPDIAALFGDNTTGRAYSKASKALLSGNRQAELDMAAGVAGAKNATTYASILQAIKTSDMGSALAALETNKGVETISAKDTTVDKGTSTDPSGIIGGLHNLFVRGAGGKLAGEIAGIDKDNPNYKFGNNVESPIMMAVVDLVQSMNKNTNKALFDKDGQVPI